MASPPPQHPGVAPGGLSPFVCGGGSVNTFACLPREGAAGLENGPADNMLGAHGAGAGRVSGGAAAGAAAQVSPHLVGAGLGECSSSNSNSAAVPHHASPGEAAAAAEQQQQQVWLGNPQHIAEIVDLFSRAGSTDNMVQQQLARAFQALAELPDAPCYLTAILACPEYSSDVRQLAGLTLKSNLQLQHQKLQMRRQQQLQLPLQQQQQLPPAHGAGTVFPTAVLNYIRPQLLRAIEDCDKSVRQAAGSAVSTLLSLEGLTAWPQALERLLLLLQDSRPDVVDGAFGALEKICEDALLSYPPGGGFGGPAAAGPGAGAAAAAAHVEEEVFAQFCLAQLLPRLFTLALPPAPLPVRKRAINCLSPFVQRRAFASHEAFDSCFPQFWQLLGQLAHEQDPDLRRFVVQGMVQVLECRPEAVFFTVSSGDAVLNFMVQCSGDEDYRLRLEALEFWPVLLRDVGPQQPLHEYHAHAIELLRRHLPQLLPVLVKNTRYHELDYLGMDPSQLEDDNAGVADVASDIKPRFHRSAHGQQQQGSGSSSSCSSAGGARAAGAAAGGGVRGSGGSGSGRPGDAVGAAAGAGAAAGGRGSSGAVEGGSAVAGTGGPGVPGSGVGTAPGTAAGGGRGDGGGGGTGGPGSAGSGDGGGRGPAVAGAGGGDGVDGRGQGSQSVMSFQAEGGGEEGGGGEEYESDDDDDDTRGTWGDGWTVRKGSALALDHVATVYREEVLPQVLPLVEKSLADSNWEVRESAVLTLGALAQGCQDTLEPYLPTVLEYLLKLCDDPKPLLRSISCWCVSRYAGWVCRHAEQFLRPVLLQVLQHVVDRNKRVQEAACSAFATIEEEACQLLTPFLPEIVATLRQALHMYQTKNLLILYDAVGTLADSVGAALQQQPLLAKKLLEPLFARWEAISSLQDASLIGLLECITNVAAAMKDEFAPFAQAVTERCIALLAQSLSDLERFEKGELAERPSRDLMESCLDLLSGTTEALGPKMQQLLLQPHMNFTSLLVRCCQDRAAGMLQSSFALVGDLSKYCVEFLEPHLDVILPILSHHLLHHATSVQNNAGWAIGELALHAKKIYIERHAEGILDRLVGIIRCPELHRSLLQNVCVSLGRLGLVCPMKLAPRLGEFLQQWCIIMRCTKNDAEKATGFQGICLLIEMNPEACAQCLPDVVVSMLAFQPCPEKLNQKFGLVLQALSQKYAEQWRGLYEQQGDRPPLPPALQQALQHRFLIPPPAGITPAAPAFPAPPTAAAPGGPAPPPAVANFSPLAPGSTTSPSL